MNRRAFVEFTDASYISYAWFVEGDKQDLMMFLYQLTKDANFVLSFRWRYYRDNKHFESKDIRNGGHVSVPEGALAMSKLEQQAKLLAIGDRVIAACIAKGLLYDTVTRVHIDGGAEAFMEKFCALPFVSMRTSEDN